MRRICLVGLSLGLAAAGAQAAKMKVTEMEVTGGTVLLQSTAGGIVVGLDQGQYGSEDGVVDRIFFFQTEWDEQNIFFYDRAELRYYGSGMLIRNLEDGRAWHLQVEGRALPTKGMASSSEDWTAIRGTELISTTDTIDAISLSQVQAHLQVRAGDLGQDPSVFKNFPGPFHDDTGEPCLGSSDPFCAASGGGGGSGSGSCGTQVISCSKSCADGSSCNITCGSGKTAECECVIDDPMAAFAKCTCNSC